MKQGPTEPSDCLSFRQAKTWVVLGLSATFFLIGALFILAPRWGATLFGIPAPEDRGLAYVPGLCSAMASVLALVMSTERLGRITHSSASSGSGYCGGALPTVFRIFG